MFLISCLGIGIFALSNIFPNDPTIATLGASRIVAIVSFVFILIGVVAYKRTPERFVRQAGTILYLLTILLFGWIIVSSGGISSPLLIFWLMIGSFIGLFGWGGIFSLFILVNGFLIWGVMEGNLSRLDVISSFSILNLPILLSYMIWHGNVALFNTGSKKRNRLSESLKSESEKSSTIIRSISDGVIMTKDSGQILLINPAAQRMIGWSAADALGLHINSVLKFEDEKGNPISDTAHPAVVSLANKKTQKNNLVIITKSDKRFSASLMITPLDEGGVIVVFRDTTKERAEEREQAEFISTASHEMRTPVASIEGYLGLALNPKVSKIDAKAYEYISKAHESAQYLGRLLRDLLEISRAEDGRLKNRITAVNAIDISRKATEDLIKKAREKGLNLLYKPTGGRSKSGDVTISPVLYVRADKDRLQECLSNLIENAIKYTPSGQITVDVNASNEYIRFSVSDTGIGIPPEDIPHLFQKFYRVDNSDTREINGSGLGLYLTRRMVESMNGRIGATSTRNKGSTFYIDLPRIRNAQATAIIEEENRRAADIAEQLRVIKEQSEVIDDNNDNNSSDTQDAEFTDVEINNSNSEIPPLPKVKTVVSEAVNPNNTPKNPVDNKVQPQSQKETQVNPVSKMDPNTYPSTPKAATRSSRIQEIQHRSSQPNYQIGSSARVRPKPIPIPEEKLLRSIVNRPNPQTVQSTAAEKYPRAPEPVEPTSKQPPVNDRTNLSPRPNTPLSSIERNPTEYISRR